MSPWHPHIMSPWFTLRFVILQVDQPMLAASVEQFYEASVSRTAEEEIQVNQPAKRSRKKVSNPRKIWQKQWVLYPFVGLFYPDMVVFPHLILSHNWRLHKPPMFIPGTPQLSKLGRVATSPRRHVARALVFTRPSRAFHNCSDWDPRTKSRPNGDKWGDM